MPSLSFEFDRMNFLESRKLPSVFIFPAYYYTSNSGVIPHGGSLKYPSFTEELDFEMEIGIIIGRSGIDISEEDALSHMLCFP